VQNIFQAEGVVSAIDGMGSQGFGTKVSTDYMKKHLPTFLSLAWIMIGIAGCSLSACQRHPRQAIERPFRATQLLITASDLPDGWKLEKFYDYVTGVYADEEALNTFSATDKGIQVWASMGAYRYRDAETAASVIKRQYQDYPLGEIPSEWKSPRIVANQSTLACANYWEPHPPSCTWAAQYEEYLLEFSTDLYPGILSLGDLAQIVTVINNKMVQYIGTPEH
jgi:hypothetical protein